MTLVTLRREGVAVEDALVEALLAAVVLVLLVGALLGNLYASRRRPAPSRVSVYDAIRRRLEAERGPASGEEK